jgi:hypothetical protein
MLGNALDFDGVDDRVVVAASPAIANLGPGTWSFWLRLRRIDGTIAYKSDDNFAEGWWIDVTTEQGGLGFAGVHDGTNHRRYTSMYVTGAWSQVAITWDGSRTGSFLYVDGRAVPPDTTDEPALGDHSNDASRDLNIGAGGPGADAHLDGTLDELRLYDRVLEPSELGALASCP